MRHQRHTHGPSKLNSLDVFAYGFALRNWNILQPVANGFSAGIRSEKSYAQGWDKFFLHGLVYHFWYARILTAERLAW